MWRKNASKKKRRNYQKAMTFDYICRGKLQGKCCTIQNLLGKQTDNSIEETLFKIYRN